MKGCIIKNNEISLKNIYECIEDVDKYNWLLTNIECYPTDVEIEKILDSEYCWITGKNLLNLLDRGEFQWVWGVFSAFPKGVKLDEVLHYDLPYADGYRGFWINPISIQHPLAEVEIVAWDGSIILAISKDNVIVEKLMDHESEAKDLELYNLE